MEFKWSCLIYSFHLKFILPLWQLFPKYSTGAVWILNGIAQYKYDIIQLLFFLNMLTACFRLGLPNLRSRNKLMKVILRLDHKAKCETYYFNRWINNNNNIYKCYLMNPDKSACTPHN